MHSGVPFERGLALLIEQRCGSNRDWTCVAWDPSSGSATRPPARPERNNVNDPEGLRLALLVLTTHTLERPRRSSRLFDLDLKSRIGRKQLVARLVEQLRAVCEDQHSPLHTEERRKLRENDHLACAGWKTDQLAPSARPVAIENCREALELIVAKRNSGLHGFGPEQTQ